MPTKEYVDNAVKTEGGFFFIPPERCILCDKGNYGDVHVIKFPEGVEMCLDCSEVHPDDRSIGWCVYKIGFGFWDEETHAFV